MPNVLFTYSVLLANVPGNKQALTGMNSWNIYKCFWKFEFIMLVSWKYHRIFWIVTRRLKFVANYLNYVDVNFRLKIFLSLFFPCADVALVTSLRDGMNLVSYEFVACQDTKKGVLILSEVITKYLHVWLCLIIIFADYSLMLELLVCGGWDQIKSRVLKNLLTQIPLRQWILVIGSPSSCLTLFHRFCEPNWSNSKDSVLPLPLKPSKFKLSFFCWV